MTEKEILTGCIQQNKSAQNALYQRYAGKVMGICIRYTKTKEEAEDIFQESFVKIFQNIKSLKEPKALQRWIKTVTVNMAVNSYYKNKKRYSHLIQVHNEIESNAFENILSYLSVKELLEVIDTLPPGYKIIFNLAVIDGYSHKEIAKMINISVGTSKSQLYKAKNMLKKKFLKLQTQGHEKEKLG